LFNEIQYISNAQFTIALINHRWFNNNKYFNSTIDTSAAIKSISIVQENSFINNLITSIYHILDTLKEKKTNTKPIKKLSKQKRQFIERHKFVIKVLNMAIKTDSVDKLIGLCNRFIAFYVYLNAQ